MRILDEISYQWWRLRINLRELRLRLGGVDRKFYCQAEIESNSKCKVQCKHCRCYYKPLEEQYKEANEQNK